MIALQPVSHESLHRQYGGHGEGKYSLLDHAYNVIWEGNYQLADGSNAPMSDFHE